MIPVRASAVPRSAKASKKAIAQTIHRRLKLELGAIVIEVVVSLESPLDRHRIDVAMRSPDNCPGTSSNASIPEIQLGVG
jgi:hypothetical protein